MAAVTAEQMPRVSVAQASPAAANPMDMPLATRALAFGAMCIGFFIALLDIQIVSASLKDIGGGLSASPDEISWVQTSYLIAEIVVIPLSGWLSRVVSTHWLFCISALGFTVTSLLCGWAWDIESMIAFRALQGFLGGSMIPTAFTTAFVYFNGQQRVVAAAIIGAISSLAPTLGPTIGGWITDNYSWHWLFFVNLAPGLLVAVLVPMLVRIDRANLALLRGADYLGMALMAIFLGTLEYALEEGPRWDWLADDEVRITAIAAAVTGPLFIWRSLSFANPVVDLRALLIRNFGLGSLLSFVTGIAIFATIYLTPLFLARVRGFSAHDIGWAVFSTGVFQLAAIPVYTLLARRVDLRWLMMFGLTCFAVGMWNFTPITSDWGWRELLLPQAFRGFAQQFAIAPIVTLSLGSLAPERLRLASGLFNLMRNLGGAIGIAGCGTILNDRTNLHYERIAETLTATNAQAVATLQKMTDYYTAVFNGDETLGATAALKQLAALTLREAQTETYADAFLILAACLMAMVALAPLMRKIAPPKAPTADAH